MVQSHQENKSNYSCYTEVQKQGGIAAFIDAEHAFDSVYAPLWC